MSGVALNQLEKSIAPKIRLQTNVNVLNNFVKSTHRELNKKIVDENKIKKLEKKKFDKIFKKDSEKLTKNKLFKPLSEKNINEGDCTTKHLKRIMNCFEEPEFRDNPISLTDIGDFTLLLSPQVNDGLKFLSHFGIIKEIKDERGRYFYQRIRLEVKDESKMPNV